MVKLFKLCLCLKQSIGQILITSEYLYNIMFFVLDDNKTQTVEYVLKPLEYLPQFRKGSNNWALTAQYVNGRHFLTAFELNEGTLIVSLS